MSGEVPSGAAAAAADGHPTRAPSAATDNQDQGQAASSNPPTPSTSQSQQQISQASTINAIAGPSASSPMSLDTIDDVCNAIFSIAVSGGDANAQFKLTVQSLLPALQALEHRGTDLGVPGAVVLSSPLQGNLDPLQVLLTQVPSTGLGLGYLFILVARCSVENVDVPYMLPFVLQYMQVADPHQLRLVPDKVTALANLLSGFLPNQPADIVAPLLALNSKLQGESRNFLTALHPIILYAALQSGQYSQVMPLLMDQAVTDIDVRAFPVTYQDNLKYHIYGGMILAVVSEYQRALYMLETAVTAPCQQGASSLLQVDAYKHLLLVQLLHDGKTTSLPKYTSPMLLSTFRQLFNTSYLDFAKAHETLNTRKVVDIATQQRKVFEQDGTLGLVSRCCHMMPARKIMKLANVYQTIEIHDVIRSLELVKGEVEASGQTVGQVLFDDEEQAKSYIRQIVQALATEKKLAIAIKTNQEGQGGEYLEFLRIRRSPDETESELQKSMNTMRNSFWTVTALEKSLSSSRDFLSKAYAMSGKATGAMSDAAFDTSNIHPGHFGMEEDLMGEKEIEDGIWDD